MPPIPFTPDVAAQMMARIASGALREMAEGAVRAVDDAIRALDSGDTMRALDVLDALRAELAMISVQMGDDGSRD